MPMTLKPRVNVGNGGWLEVNNIINRENVCMLLEFLLFCFIMEALNLEEILLGFKDKFRFFFQRKCEIHPWEQKLGQNEAKKHN